MAAPNWKTSYAPVHDEDEESVATYVDSVDNLEKTLGQRQGLLRPGGEPWASPVSRGSRRESRLVWLRWSLVVALQTAIIALLVLRPSTSSSSPSPSAPADKKVVETGADINGLYVPEGHDYRRLKMEQDTYMPNMTTNANRMAVRKLWDELMPLGSGSVAIHDYKDYPMLGEPIEDDPIRSGPLFEASWTHALHCLYYSVDSYHQLIVNGRTGEENPHHASHCFEYLRQNILCNMDMTLEGSYSANKESGGQAHVCRNRQHAIDWIEARRVDDMQDIVGP